VSQKKKIFPLLNCFFQVSVTVTKSLSNKANQQEVITYGSLQNAG
jgi:hypothetical protein